jgi:hypothetical protein
VLAHAALAALFFFSGDLAAHEVLNQREMAARGFPRATVPSEMGGIGMPNLKENDRMAIIPGTSDSVVGACHYCGSSPNG